MSGTSEVSVTVYGLGVVHTYKVEIEATDTGIDLKRLVKDKCNSIDSFEDGELIFNSRSKVANSKKLRDLKLKGGDKFDLHLLD